MTDATTRAAELLKGHRESSTASTRSSSTPSASGSSTPRPWASSRPNTTFPRPIPPAKRQQIARLEDLAKRADLDPEFAKKFLNFIIAEVIQHHKQHQETGS
jgi:chorismate mutase